MASRAIKVRKTIKKRHVLPAFLMAFTVVIALLAAAVLGVYAVCESWLDDLPDYTDVDAFNTSQPTEVYASDGTTLLAKFQLENREPVDLDAVSQYVLDGTVATEDERFYEHTGYDVAGIIRALFNDIMGGELEGGSTITQQFVRNTLLADEMDEISVKRKIREIYLAVKIEEIYSKDEILQMYLNTINYGQGAYGIQAAAQRYFSKDASDLTLAEAATLVGIPQSPSYNNPIDYPENCLERRNLVLDRMLSNGYITQEEHDAAQAEEIELDPTLPDDDGIYKYPYFTSYVRDLLTDADGKYAYTTNEVFRGGLTVITTLDTTMQDYAEEAAETKRDSLPDGVEAAIVAIDPSNGYVKAMVGGSDYSASKVNLATGSGTNASDPGRPCGSSFKTFTLLTSIEAGISPSTELDCSSPAELPGYGQELNNYGGANYGTRTIAEAFAISSNTGFVRLEMSMGTSRVYEMAKRLGISSPLNETDPTLTLGTYNVTMLDMADAYATIANGGTYYDSEPIIQIIGSDGEVVVDNTETEGEQVLSAEVSYAATEVMKGVITNGTGTAARLTTGQVAAGKTGTGSDYKDITFIGITPQLSVGIWLGDPNNEISLEGTSAADVFSNFVSKALADAPLEEFPVASSPEYRPYEDEVYHVGSWSGMGSDEEEEAEEEEEEEEEAEEATTETTTPDATPQGTTEGTETPNAGGGEAGGGGDSGGGDSGGGDEGGGDSGGGDSGGGDEGGGDDGG